MDFDDLDDLDPVEVADASTEERELGVVVYGATGFIGGLVVEHLDALLSSPGVKPHSWALAGRNLNKLRQLARKCKSAPGVLQVDGPTDVSQMANKARVVLSVAGPCSDVGEDVIRECVNQVTHYVDVSTEVNWVQSIVGKYHARAKEKGAMIVPCAGAACSLDEILCSKLVGKLGPLRQYREYLRQQGGWSGGCVDTAIAEMKAMTQERLDVLNDPFCLGGARGSSAGGEADADCRGAEPDPVVAGVWLTSTPQAALRARLLRRTRGLFEETALGEVSYGKDLTVAVRDWSSSQRGALQHYQQAGLIQDLHAAPGIAARLQADRKRARLPETRAGPAAALRAEGSMQVYAVAEGENGDWAHGHCRSGDALEVTVLAATAAALVLVEELDAIRPRERAGVLTPAFAFHGSTWAERLLAGPVEGSPLRASVDVSLAEGKLPAAALLGEEAKPLYEQASPLWTTAWGMPGLNGPGAAGATAWPAWEPLPAERWREFPRAGGGEWPASMGEFKKVVDQRLPGEFWGIEFPFTPTRLQELGPKWLTKALHTTGAMSRDNEITEFVKFKVKAWDVTKSDDPDDNDFGGAGCKVFLDVKYKKDPGELSEHMFIKMPHEFNGKNERFKNSMARGDWFEVMFYNLLGGRLPVRTPRGYFCDMNRKTTNFCMILEAVPYGDRWGREYPPNAVWPNIAKYRDWSIPLSTTVDIYYAHARAQGRLYGWYHNNCMPLLGATTDQVDFCFRDEGDIRSRAHIFNIVRPMGREDRDKFFLSSLTDPGLVPFVMGSGQPPNIAEGYVALAEDFVRNTARHTFPREWTTEAYLDQWFGETKEMYPYLAEMGWYSQMMPEYFTFCHPNCMIDNAFYWRDEAGVAQCGLLDWGGAGHMAMNFGVAGCWIASEPALMDEHEDKLLKVLLDEYEQVTGVKLDFEEFYLHLKLAYIAIHVGNCASVRWCTSIRPKEEWHQVEDRFDGKIDDGFMMRCYHVQTEFFLGMWKKRNPYPYFQEFMRRTGMPRK
uniref:Saccharopine dehydrogenase NADP binding domain-containing protein n=1 Tax=Alexandrium monilatum TaxID=311494 RepID=A0A7S4R3I8_9DINO